MFSSNPNYTKLKTHLRLAINRLKLLEKKKAELAQKSRYEIANFIKEGKAERAKIRVEHIIREDYLVEAMEVVEMYCDLLLARFGLITQMKELDEGLSEAIASLIWVAPRLQADVQELKIVSDLLTAKYGKPFADNCRAETESAVSAKLKHKMSIQSPPKKLVEKYLIEIASCFNIPYEPDPQVMQDDGVLIDLSQDNKNNLGGGGGMPYGFIGFPQPPALPTPFSYPAPSVASNEDNASAPPPSYPYGAPFSYNIPPAGGNGGESEKKEDNTGFKPSDKPVPQPRTNVPIFPEIPDLPSVPSDMPGNDIDFDDLTKRFEQLKKKK
ncbi:IST1 homolog isoform X2 [Atheta coriaria]|uniref:IST1 homolog isoform X2 n=1 Tax=Dalotia coriaria TaxID=877792 RepID=UPI0031F36898